MRTVDAFVLVAFATGCGDSPAAAPTGESTSGGASTEGSSGLVATNASSSDASTSGGASVDSSSSSSSSGSLEGPGCGAPPVCEGVVFEGSIRIESAADLPVLEGISAVTGFVEIIGTDLECLDTLTCLEEVGRDLRLQDNAALRSTEGLSNVLTVGAVTASGGNVIISENSGLESLEGFAVERVGGVLAVTDNDALREIPGFSDLRRVDALSVQDNPVLQSLEGLHSLEQLGACSVSHNGMLCISEVFAVCGDVRNEPEGVTDYNDDDC